MAAVEITISGVLYDKYNRTQQNVVLIGEASLTGLQIGGGPIQPPAGGGQPPGVPTFPIALPPGSWPGGGAPPGPGYPPSAEHPIVIPPDKPAEPIQPPIEWKAIWAGPEQGWVVVGVPNVPHPTPSAKK